jgi:uncharacterized protein YndB with AHSA1/START domain
METTSLTLTEQYNATPARLFQAWSDPKALPEWFLPAPNMKAIVHDFNFTVGGDFKINVQDPDGKDNIAEGKFVEIIPNQKISMTWQWTHSTMDHNNHSSILTILFAAKDGGTELTLMHEKLESEDDVKNHTEGWQGVLDQLAKWMA